MIARALQSFGSSHPWLIRILIAFTILASIYSVITPIFEAGDEIWHYPFVQSLATGHGLPIQDPNTQTLWAQEGGQPPLYYAIAALATFWIDTRDLADRLWLNPHARIGIPLDYGNKNMVVHTSAENFPWHNTTLAVHLIRFLSIILSIITVALTYFFALEIKKDKRLATIAAALVAFNPMFIFISASVNNDNLATPLATLALLLIAQLIKRGATMRRFGLLGIVLGLGALTKISNAGLFAVAAVVFAYLLWNDKRQGDKETRRQSAIFPISLSPHLLVGFTTCAAIVIIIALWWYARNWLLYNDPLAFNVWVQIAGGRPTPMTIASLLGEFQGFRISFWGNFGAVNLIAPDWVYTIFDLFTVLAIIGLVIGLVRKTLPRLLWLPALWIVLIIISLVRWTWLTMASQGRLIFPAINAVAILLAYGISQIPIPNSRITHHASRITNYVLPTFLFAFAVITPITIIAPAYALPSRFADDSIVTNPVHIIFDNQAELIGYDLPQKSVTPGNTLPLTIYWRALTPIAEDFSVSIRLISVDGKIIGRWDAFPGEGLYPTRVWQPDEVIQDQYRVPVSVEAIGPGVGSIQVALYRRMPLENLTAIDPRGNVVTPTIARFKIAGQSKVRVENPVNYKFEDQLALIGYAWQAQARSGDSVAIKLYWQPLAIMTEDYTVFVHLIDTNGMTFAQQDHQPQYPTSFWGMGDMVADDYSLSLPRDLAAGDYKIEIGVYRASDGARLATANGDSIRPGSIRVAP